MHVAELWQYPVKSMIGILRPEATITTTGVAGDRAWALRDEERGGIRGAKKLGDLMKFSAHTTDGGAVEIVLPDGAVVRSTDVDVDARLSEALGHRVSLWPLQPVDDLAHYRRGPADHADPIDELREIFGREPDEPFPDFTIFPPEIMEYESPPGTYLDAFPLLVMTTSALRSLRLALPDSVVDIRRFRPNLVVDTGDEQGHPEFEWVGNRLSIGGVVLDIAARCPRCVMVTREVSADIPQDRAVLRHVVRELDQNVGVYATVVSPGSVAVGDEVRLSR